MHFPTRTRPGHPTGLRRRVAGGGRASGRRLAADPVRRKRCGAARHPAPAPPVAVHDAARQLWRTVPMVTHLHGTELLMLEEIEHLAKTWPCAAYWVGRLRSTAYASDRVIVASSHVAQRAMSLLKLDPSGDGRPERSRHRPLPSAAAEYSGEARAAATMACGRAVRLGKSGRTGFDPVHVRGSGGVLDPVSGQARPVLLYVGRSPAPAPALLLRAYAPVRLLWARFRRSATDLGWPSRRVGGRTPIHARARIALDGVFFVGWRDHDDLRLSLRLRRPLVAHPSTRRSARSTWRRWPPACR